MKNTIILGAAMTFASFGAFAQDATSPAAAQPQGQRPRPTTEDRAKQKTDQINALAQLTPDQYNKVLDLNKKYMAQRDEIRKSGVQGEDMKAKIKALNDQQAEQLKTVLTPAQVEKVNAARKEFQGGHKPE